MLPLLRSSAAGEQAVHQAIEKLAQEFLLSVEQRAELLPSGKQTKFANRVQWAKTYLTKAGLLEPTTRAHFKISLRGSSVLHDPPGKITIQYLSQWQEFNDFRFKVEPVAIAAAPDESELTPDETIRRVWQSLNSALAADLLDRIRISSPAFFETLTVKLLVAMGYGGSLEEAGKALGQSGDNGVDGVIDEDQLGLGRIYIQAKRYKEGNAVGPGDIRDFFGALDQHKALKGIFITASTFTSAARATATNLSKRIVLIDGERLAKLMIQFEIGCRASESIVLKRLDEEFFDA